MEDVTDHRVAVVGAGSGIGRASALLLGRRGARIACIDRDPATAAATAKSLTEIGATAEALPLDVTDAARVDRTMGDLIDRWGGLEALLNCAGMTGRTGVLSHEISMAEFDEVYGVNLRAAFALSSAVLPTLVAAGYGRVLHVSSMAGKEGNAGMVAYSSTKAGLIGMVKAQGKEYAQTGVTINALAPAVIQTPMVDALPQKQIDYMTEKIPMKRLGQLDEVASLIGWILSPACSFTTGFTFDFSGGRAVY
jgi:2-dehydro-3-deoxy-L-rhamnonate dehydrogenase (NAD+)